MSAATCPTCSRTQPRVREHCCPTAAETELQELRAKVAEQENEVRRLKDENDVLEDLRREVLQAAEAQGVYL